MVGNPANTHTKHSTYFRLLNKFVTLVKSEKTTPQYEKTWVTAYSRLLNNLTTPPAKVCQRKLCTIQETVIRSLNLLSSFLEYSSINYCFSHTVTVTKITVNQHIPYKIPQIT